ncbi:hypothetical protein TNCV_2860691 [Trichonephila clavipes]|nr:hypothetical protein TNCV_2860691 [Trichonephila clavipes]
MDGSYRPATLRTSHIMKKVGTQVPKIPKTAKRKHLRLPWRGNRVTMVGITSGSSPIVIKDPPCRGDDAHNDF